MYSIAALGVCATGPGSVDLRGATGKRRHIAPPTACDGADVEVKLTGRKWTPLFEVGILC